MKHVEAQLRHVVKVKEERKRKRWKKRRERK